MFFRRLLLAILLLIITIELPLGETMSKEIDRLVSKQTLNEIPNELWERLGRQRIFFAHQSVGNNIMQGIQEIIEKYPKIRLKISEFRSWRGSEIIKTMQVGDFVEPVFAHERNIGKNNHPLSKIDDFVSLLQDGVGDQIDIAFLKFCFVDINSGTDINKLFKKYSESIGELKSHYPEMTIVHFTVPLLKKEQIGIVQKVKGIVKRILGKKNDDFWSNNHNVARNEYNKLIVNFYSGKDPIFDLALLESTKSTGKRETFTFEGHEYYALAAEYTDDGGHLNEKGREYIAGKLLIFLANL